MFFVRFVAGLNRFDSAEDHALSQTGPQAVTRFQAGRVADYQRSLGRPARGGVVLQQSQAVSPRQDRQGTQGVESSRQSA